MDREVILKRIEQLKKDKELLFAHYHSLDGAIQDCEYWLKEMDDGQERPVR